MQKRIQAIERVLAKCGVSQSRLMGNHLEFVYGEFRIGVRIDNDRWIGFSTALDVRPDTNGLQLAYQRNLQFGTLPVKFAIIDGRLAVFCTYYLADAMMPAGNPDSGLPLISTGEFERFFAMALRQMHDGLAELYPDSNPLPPLAPFLSIQSYGRNARDMVLQLFVEHDIWRAPLKLKPGLLFKGSGYIFSIDSRESSRGVLGVSIRFLLQSEYRRGETLENVVSRINPTMRDVANQRSVDSLGVKILINDRMVELCWCAMAFSSGNSPIIWESLRAICEKLLNEAKLLFDGSGVAYQSQADFEKKKPLQRNAPVPAGEEPSPPAKPPKAIITVTVKPPAPTIIKGPRKPQLLDFGDYIYNPATGDRTYKKDGSVVRLPKPPVPTDIPPPKKTAARLPAELKPKLSPPPKLSTPSKTKTNPAPENPDALLKWVVKKELHPWEQGSGRSLQQGVLHLRGEILSGYSLPSRTGKVELDHILICEAGIFILECKDYRGEITGGLNAAWVHKAGGREMNVTGPRDGNPCDQVQSQINALRNFLRKEGNSPLLAKANLFVRGLVLFPSEAKLGLKNVPVNALALQGGRGNATAAFNLDKFIDLLNNWSFPKSLSPEQIAEISKVIRES